MENSSEVGAVGPVEPPPAGFAGLLSRIQSDSYRTLRWLAGLVAGVAALRLAATLLGGESLGAYRWGLGLLVAASLGVAVATTRTRLPPRAFPAVALGFEVVVALALATQLLGWQDVLGPEGWPLAAVPTVAVWIIVFCGVIPLPPAQHLIGILLASLGVPVAFFASLSLFEVPPEVGPEQNLRVFLQLVVPTFIASAIAFQTARRAYGLSLGWTDARRMGSYELIEKLGEGGRSRRRWASLPPTRSRSTTTAPRRTGPSTTSWSSWTDSTCRPSWRGTGPSPPSG